MRNDLERIRGKHSEGVLLGEHQTLELIFLLDDLGGFTLNQFQIIVVNHIRSHEGVVVKPGL